MSATLRRSQLRARYEEIDDELKNESELFGKVEPAHRHSRELGLYDAIESIEVDVDNVSRTQHDHSLAEEELMLPPPKRRRTTPLAVPRARKNSAPTSALGSPGRPASAGTVSSITPTKGMPILISSSPSLRSSSPELSPPSLSPTLNRRAAAPRFRFGSARVELEGGQTLSTPAEAIGFKQAQIRGHNHFILPEIDPDEQRAFSRISNTNLALLFSPQKQKRYSYAPGSMAATVRDWVLGTAAATSPQVFRLHVNEVWAKAIRGAQLVLGKDDTGQDGSWMLVGSPQSDKASTIQPGSIVRIAGPSWEVELQKKSWKVGVKWYLEDKAPL